MSSIKLSNQLRSIFMLCDSLFEIKPDECYDLEKVMPPFKVLNAV